MRLQRFICAIFSIFALAVAQPPEYSAQCKAAHTACEDDTDCVHRLAVLQSTCVTNTCQPQCRTAVLNLYQNRLGRALLRTDGSCVPGRHELDLCNLLPTKTPLYCNLAKLACEADLQCNAKWEVFVSECEAEAGHGQCSERCRQRLNETLHTVQGAAFTSCTCTKRDDALCDNLKDVVLRACSKSIAHAEEPMGNSVNEPAPKETSNEPGAGSAIVPQLVPLASLCLLLIFRWTLSLY